MPNKRRLKIVELLIAQGFMTEKQVIRVIDEQQKTGKDIATLVAELGFISQHDLTAMLGEQIQITHRKRLGEVLIDHALITPEQLQEALQYQATTHETLGQCLIQLKIIDESTLLDVLGAQLDTPHVVLEHIVFNHKMLELVPLTYIELYKVIPLFLRGNQLTIAMADPTNLRTLDHLRFTTGKEVEPVIASEVSIEHYIRKLKSGDVVEVNKPLDTMERVNLDALNNMADPEFAVASEYGEAVVNIVNNLVFNAIEENASDIHIEETNSHIRVRYRIDGVLIERRTLDLHYLAPIISRLKIMANMDIAEKRKPQDGKFHLHHDKHQVDVRVSTFPTVSRDKGLQEKVVLRVLNADSGSYSLGDIGFPAPVLQKMKEILGYTNGLILVTGPTGSGKSTSLYAALKHLQSPEVNIVTMEDPVEYAIDGIAQGQIHNKSGFTFASGMRAILRQDPDIIMVGEMRDKETCELAVQAALTGHLVLSTLHTNDAASAFTRLMDMSIEPYLITSSLRGILAQRLVRKICPHCRDSYTPPSSLSAEFGYPLPETLFRGTGCAHCANTGYSGRTPIFELLVPDETIVNMVMHRATALEIHTYAVKSGLSQTLRFHGFHLIKEGITTVEEVMMKTERDGITLVPYEKEITEM